MGLHFGQAGRLLESIRVVIVVDCGPEALSLGCGLGSRQARTGLEPDQLVQQDRTNPERGFFY